MLAAWCQRLDKLDVCVVFNCETGIRIIFVKMSFEKARISLNYLYNHVTKDTAELRKLLTMSKATFYRNLKNMAQQSKSKKNREVADPWFPIKLMMKNQFAKKPSGTL